VPLEEPTDARCQRLEKECISDRQQFEESKARCTNLEKECDMLRDENLSLQQKLSAARQEAHRLATEKQELAGELGTERQKLDELKQDIRMISRGFLQREGQLTSLYTKSKAILENCKTSQVATLP